MIAVRRVSACRAAAPWLGAIAEGRFDDDEAVVALGHVATCPGCRSEAERLALLVVQLRRLAGPDPAEARSTVAPQADRVWLSLRARIERGRDGWRVRVLRWRADLAGLVVSALVVAAAVGPMAVQAPFGGGGAEPTGGQADQWDRRAWLIEASYDAQRRPESTAGEAAVGSGPQVGGTSILRSVPDRLLPIRKEVPFERTTGQPAVAVDRAVGPS